MTTLRHWVRFAVLASLVATPMSAALATPVLTSGHADLKVKTTGTALDAEWHVAATPTPVIIGGTGALEYSLSELIASGTTTVLANSSQANMLGVPVNTRVGKIGETGYEPKIGWENEAGVPITVTFNPLSSSFPLGGQFAMASESGVVFSSYDPTITGAPNNFPIEAGAHQHYDWLFSKEGTYVLNFTWSGDGFASTTGSITVQAVPEPSTVAMLAMAGGTVAIAALRRVRRSHRTTSA